MPHLSEYVFIWHLPLLKDWLVHDLVVVEDEQNSEKEVLLLQLLKKNSQPFL